MRQLLSPLANLTSPSPTTQNITGRGADLQQLSSPGQPPPAAPAPVRPTGPLDSGYGDSSTDHYLTTAMVVAAVCLTAAGLMVIICFRRWTFHRFLLPRLQNAAASSAPPGSRAQVHVECVPPSAASPRKPAVVVLQPDEMVEVAFQEDAPPTPALRDGAANRGEQGTAGGQAAGLDRFVSIPLHDNPVGGVHGQSASRLRPGISGAALHVAVVDLARAGSLPQPKQ